MFVPNIPESGSMRIIAKENIGQKHVLPLDQCLPGMHIAETIYNNMGAIIILDDTLLDALTIRRLRGLGIDKLKVYIGREESADMEATEEFRAFYTKNVSVLKDVFQDVFDGKPLDTEKVDQLTSSIISMNDLEGTYIKTLGKIKDADDYLLSHSINVAMLAMLMAKWMKLDKREVNEIVRAGLLHDIGKMKLSEEIRSSVEKENPLSKSINEDLKKHVRYSWEIVTESMGKEGSIPATILMHHEQEDGSGYPNRLKGDEISLHAKIVSTVNFFDQLTTAHFKLKSISPFEAFEIIEKESFNRLDSTVVLKFLENAPAYFLNEKFFLSNGEIGEVIFINPQNIGRPVLRVGESYLDLSQEKTIRIQSML